ncbi:hypothetical protein J6590_051666 [Homalodisca vitripennis]|nr:hypothetical protein J6590_051666 [Homalodisca vitripennis]
MDERMKLHFRVLGALQIIDLICKDVDSVVTDLYLGIDGMRNNQLSSLLVAPHELIKYLKDINSQLKTGSTLPLVVTEHTIHDYYSLIRVSAWLVDNHVIRFFLNIPLKNNDRLYNLYKVLPVPTGTPGAEKNHLYTYVQPHTDYIAVSTDEQRYIPMTRCQVNDCKGKTVKMCVGPNVVNNLASGQDTCESAYFRQITPPKELCDTRLSYVATSIWTEIPGTDRWIFVLPREEVMTFTCPGTDGLPEHEGTVDEQEMTFDRVTTGEQKGKAGDTIRTTHRGYVVARPRPLPATRWPRPWAGPTVLPSTGRRAHHHTTRHVEMLLGTMQEDGLVSKPRATDFSIAAIMAREAPRPVVRQQPLVGVGSEKPLTTSKDALCIL